MPITRITKVSSHMTSSAMPPSDNASRNIQNQIAVKQQRLNRLSSDSAMSTEEKEKERQKIQKQLAELNRKLRLLQAEQKEDVEQAAKEQEKKAVLKEEILEKTVQNEQSKSDSPDKPVNNAEKTDLSPKEIQQLFAADSQLQLERVQGNVTKQKESTENVLEAEIKMDELYGSDTTAKKEELASLRDKENFWTEPKEQPEEQTSSSINPNAKIIIRES